MLLASQFVMGYLPLVTIPQNWFIDARGKLQWLQVGFGNEPDWQAMMLAKLEEVTKSAAP